MAASALAGLASTEDFTKVRLRKTAGPEGKDEYRGTKPIMLIHIKGDEKNAISIYIQTERAEDRFDHRSYAHNLSSCGINSENNSGVNGIQTHDLCNTGAALYHY